MRDPVPSPDQWLREAKSGPDAAKTGMYLLHNGVVRQTPKALVRQGDDTAPPVTGMRFSCDHALLEKALAETRRMPGIQHARAWVNEGTLAVGDDLMYVLVGGDIRPHVADALQFLVDAIKSRCVSETELY